MATKISTKILIKILNNVQSTHDLYSFLLVNRIWCKTTIPILWKLTFGQECCTSNKGEKKALCIIRTYISCMDTQTRTLLTQNGFDLSSSPPQTIFDYPSYTNKFIINNLVYFISIYLKQIIGLDQDDNSDDDDDDDDNDDDDYYDYYYNRNYLAITKSGILFREICKLIINRCTFFEDFKLMEVPEKFSKNFHDYSDLIGSMLDLPGASKVFEKLESFTSTVGNYELCPLYESLALICDGILNMDLSLYSVPQLQSLEKLISVQKRLENLSIYASKIECNSLLWAIISKKETLKSLRLESVNFYRFKRKSSPIGQFGSLQGLYIRDCLGLLGDRLFFASSFAQLSNFHFKTTHGPQAFIIKILETANTNLKNICLELYPKISFDTFSAILNYCTKIPKLTLYNLSLEQVIAIFNNNFNELRRFTFNCVGKGFDADKLLCEMAENIPESLETIKIIIYENQWIFSADSLRKFFEGWSHKGEGNKKIILKRTKHSRHYTLSDNHFKVIEEYGVQFDIE